MPVKDNPEIAPTDEPQSKSQEFAQERNLCFSDNAPSWEELTELMTTRGKSLGDLSLTQSDYFEVGPPNAVALKRTFGKEGPIRVKLYRDRAAWCPFCQKVWIQLEEKQIPYTVEHTNLNSYGDKSESFLAKVPSGFVPALELRWEESAVITELIEKEFPETPLLPHPGTAAAERYSEVFPLLKETEMAWIQSTVGSELSQEQRTNLEAVMEEIESVLEVGGGPFFLGEQLSLLDIFFVTTLDRMSAVMTYYKGFRMRGEGKYPNLEKWFAVMETRPAYLATKVDYYTLAWIIPALRECVISKEAEPFANAIGGNNGSWSLPLEPLNANSVDPYSPGDRPEHDTYFAAKKLITNHEAVVKFALRACGKRGDRPRTAPLSDPTAEPGMHAFEPTDTALRHVAHALLAGVAEKQAQDARVMTQSAASQDMLPSDDTVMTLRYVRDRVGVPKDMTFPEARQLRAHLNWMIDQVTSTP